MTDEPLAGRNIVVTRPVSAGPMLQRKLAAVGAHPMSVPVTQEMLLRAGRAAAEVAIREAAPGDTIAVTSTAASRVVSDFARPTIGVSVAAVGPATARVLESQGWPVSFIPARHTAIDLATGLGEPSGTGRVIYVAAADPRPEFAATLRSSGWTVDHIAAYQTVRLAPDPATIHLASEADGVVFTSGSTVDGWRAVATVEQTPRVATIGPSTTRAAVDAGLRVDAEARVQSLDGLIDALIELFDDD